ncbi:MAG: hypothetical protein OEV81_06480 [Betaproteobacteria bacterium]|nr:hypothetical protein [Betaproteobacteria bacterium]MDH5222916.1 hypothetical protein [Betaproteobacteria bacterium]MDH5351225.1 hypothetical protein [Betaproteobacteria bacterium]
MTSPIPPWLALLVAAVVYGVMFSLGLMIGREQIAAAPQRRGVLAFALFAVLVPVPAAAVLAVGLFDLKSVAAARGGSAPRGSPRPRHQSAARCRGRPLAGPA